MPRYHRPTATDSELGWLRIAVELGPVRFYSQQSPSSHGGAGPVSHKRVFNKQGCERPVKSLHQNFAGDGYNPEDYVQFHHPTKGYNEGADHSLGGTPNERRTSAIVRRLRRK